MGATPTTPQAPVLDIVSDAGFNKLAASEQQTVLSQADPSFGKIAPDEFSHVVNHLRSSATGGSVDAATFEKANQQTAESKKATIPNDPTWKDYANILATTLATAAPAYGGAAKAAPVAAEATEASLPSFKALWHIAKATEAEAEVSSSKIMSGGWKQFADMASRGAQEASESGNSVKALQYKAAGAAAAAYSKYEAAWAWLGKNVPSLPIGIKIALTAKVAKEGVDWLTKDDEE